MTKTSIRNALIRYRGLIGVLCIFSAAVGLIASSTTQAQDVQTASRQRVLLGDTKHPDISIYCPGEQKDGWLRITATDAGNCTVILPPPATAPQPMLCEAVLGKGKQPIAWECRAK